VQMTVEGALGLYERVDRGLEFKGASADKDMKTGGADNITIRIVSQLQRAWPVKFGSVSGDFALIMAPDLLDRLDVAFSNEDSYGEMRPGQGDTESREGVMEDLRQSIMGGDYDVSAELILRRGVSARRILRVNAPKSRRAALILAYREAGVTHVNGIPVDSFVISESSCGAIYDKFVKPEGY